jgi:F420H(2)-dependent quinone reductase
MRLIKWLGIALVAYVGLVVAFECLVGFMGKREAQSGVLSNERWIVISTSDSGGSRDTVIAGVELDDHLYVAANHWPRGWYRRAIQNPDVEVMRGGEKKPYRAVPLSGDEEVHVASQYVLPFAVRFLTGFPPRSFLRLDPR